MSVTELREKIYKVVGTIDDTVLLQIILDTAQSRFRKDDDPFTQEELNILNERREKYLKGESKAIPWREVQERLKKKYDL